MKPKVKNHEQNTTIHRETLPGREELAWRASCCSGRPTETSHHNDHDKISWSWCQEPEGQDPEEKGIGEAGESQNQHSGLRCGVNGLGTDGDL